MVSVLRTVNTIESLRRHVCEWRAQDLRTAVVPTMGALHDGHLKLVEQGLRLADRVVVTLFVNPTQFAPHEDLDTYPRDERGDARKLKEIGAHLIFAPSALEMYPDGFATSVSVAGPAKAGLEDVHRPHFFDGVATVVAKLFIQAGCDYAVFGEKDYQQLKVVTRMAQDLDIPVTVIGVETVREPDGLAMSSRNAYLSPEERKTAPELYRALRSLANEIREGSEPAAAVARAEDRLTARGFKVDYVAARNAENLGELTSRNEPVRILAAARLGKTRLIDNISV